MLLDFYQHLPQHINPIAFSIGFFSVRWYALSYIVGFVAVYSILLWRIENNDFKKTTQISNFQPASTRGNDRLSTRGGFSISNKFQNSKLEIKNLVLDYLLMIFFLALVGGRLGYVLFYDFSYFLAHPIAIISPFDLQSGQYVGLFGMSYHGALLAVIAGSYVFCKKKNIDFWRWTDFVVPAIPAGYFFGRLGNFFNGELYGRVTTSPVGMYFQSDRFNLRLPSQLFEAAGEGLLMFVILWALRNKVCDKGILSSLYIMMYATVRFAIEFWRQPDAQLGLFFGFLSMGQILSLVMLVFGVVLYYFRKMEMVL
ncbi:MAG: prolipoprotein diacylglyceryl transferase [Candidatus Moranbacteria bacterium]|nr:prolipoprotein diacylglyceryl transferase [Candidatus Moranbacteria bacterium]